LEQSVQGIRTSDRRHFFVCAVKNPGVSVSVFDFVQIDDSDDDDSDDSGAIYFPNGGVILSIYHNCNKYIIIDNKNILYSCLTMK
jgi:hypothetical protein